MGWIKKIYRYIAYGIWSKKNENNSGRKSPKKKIYKKIHQEKKKQDDEKEQFQKESTNYKKTFDKFCISEESPITFSSKGWKSPPEKEELCELGGW